MKTNLKKLAKSQIEIEFELSAEELQKYVDKALAHFQQHVKVDGFRPGQVPKKMIEEKVGSENLLMEAGDLAVKEVYPKYVRENNLEPVSHPEVNIVKIALGNPFIFKVKVSVLPEIKLADYKKIASQIKTKKADITEEEVKDTLEQIKKSRAKFSQADKAVEKGDFIEIEYESPQLSSMSVLPDNKDKQKTKDQFMVGEAGFVKGFEENLMGMKANEEKTFSVLFPKNFPRKDLADKNVEFKVKILSVHKVELPEINDEFAKSLGKFDSLESLKKNIREGMKMEKEYQIKDETRAILAEKISAESKMEVPDCLIDSEKDRLLENFKHNVTEHMSAKGGGMTFENYLSSLKQDEKTLRDSFAKEAEKKVKNFLVIQAIGKEEKIVVSDSEIEEEVSKMIKNYSKENLVKIDIERLKEYTKGVIFNEKVFQVLEKLFHQ